jgi:hypothetical protein
MRKNMQQNLLSRPEVCDLPLISQASPALLLHF